MSRARRTDWTITEMPAATAHLDVDRTYNYAEFARLCFGVIPNSMDEKWFVFFEEPWLYAHRSLTGSCIYRIRFEPVPEGARIAEVIVNRDECKETDASAEAWRVQYLLDSVVQRNARYVRR